jgi:hypothetical protein
MVAAGRRKKALLFEKRSKNFSPLDARVAATHASNVQKFFGSCFQKRTASTFSPAGVPPGYSFHPLSIPYTLGYCRLPRLACGAAAWG